jgi:hypothetical protein
LRLRRPPKFPNTLSEAKTELGQTPGKQPPESNSVLAS